MEQLGPIGPNPLFSFNNRQVFETHLTRTAAIIRIVALLALSAYDLKFIGSVNITFGALLCYAGWTAYKQFIRKDPLMQALVQIAGGQAAFDQLPQPPLTWQHNKSRVDCLSDVSSRQLKEPMYKTHTPDGRCVVFIQAPMINQVRIFTNDDPFNVTIEKAFFVFIEKMSYADLTQHPDSYFQRIGSSLHLATGMFSCLDQDRQRFLYFYDDAQHTCERVNDLLYTRRDATLLATRLSQYKVEAYCVSNHLSGKDANALMTHIKSITKAS